MKTELPVAETHSRMGLPAWGQATADDARRQPVIKANRYERFHRSGKRSTADRFAKIPSGDNDTSAQPQSERITIQGSRKSIAFVGKESNRLISDAFAERQNEPKGEL